MPLGRSRRKHGKPSSDDSLKDALYDQLLASLSQGGEPLPDDQEYWEFRRGWFRLYGASEDDPDPRWPWPMQRKRAFELMRVFDWETYLRIREVISEVDKVERPEIDEQIEHQTEEQFKTEWIKWRSETIQRYRLEALLEIPQFFGEEGSL
jgi:hypothetical protein